VLYRLLSLCFFSDAAKQQDAMDQPLFAPTSELKSTRQVLLALSRHVLQGEGDFVKHLSRVRLVVTYHQAAVEEIDFTMFNLAVDLRDGTRLARLAELWLEKPRHVLLQTLRLPAVSRLQKLFNVHLVLTTLGCSSLEAHHVVDGHREHVLQLLWEVVATHCLDDLLPRKKVQAELDRLHTLRSPTGLVVGESSNTKDVSELVLQWAHAVCSRFGRAVHNWSDSFADGKVICLLVHYYHPKLLRLQDISNDNCQTNAKLANQRLFQIGGIVPELVASGKDKRRTQCEDKAGLGLAKW
jgi:abnormal spindle-like microcephaly-associated protein